MKVLIACEFSGVVREAFNARGHDAWSCDLLQTEKNGQHISGDVLIELNKGWDLMIAHPPCTYLAKCGLHYLKTRPDRAAQLAAGFNFVKALWSAPINKICIENPAGYLCTNWMKPMQIIHPFHFGEQENKETCLWLKNLPSLFLTGQCEKPRPKKTVKRRDGRNLHYSWGTNKSAKDRSRTFQGIANAMAEQWG